jgi:hypothetical protein
MPDDPPYAMLRYKNRSSIGTLIPDCSLEETHEDKVQVTTHPVEVGANSSDHAFVLPRQLQMKIAFADYKGTGSDRNTGHSRVKYEELLSLLRKRDPLSIETQRQSYSNMLVTGVSVSVDQKTASGILAVVHLTEIRQAEALANVIVKPTPANAQSDPQSTQPVTDLGRQVPTPSGVSTTPAPAGSPPDSSAVASSGSSSQIPAGPTPPPATPNQDPVPPI